jgi:hypothetical protein
MAEIEEESIEDNGISPGTSKGKFKDTFKDYSWELNVKEIPPEYREGEEEIEISQKLNEVKLAVYRQGQSRKYYLTTYIISYDEEEEE